MVMTLWACVVLRTNNVLIINLYLFDNVTLNLRSGSANIAPTAPPPTCPQNCLLYGPINNGFWDCLFYIALLKCLQYLLGLLLVDLNDFTCNSHYYSSQSCSLPCLLFNKLFLASLGNYLDGRLDGVQFALNTDAMGGGDTFWWYVRDSCSGFGAICK